VLGRIASLHLHPPDPGEPLTAVETLTLIAGEGIQGNKRYFGRRDRQGKLSRRQVSLIAREQIAEHAAVLGLQDVAPGRVRSNIETLGIDLMALVAQDVAVGEAVLHLYEPRTPCAKMDRICAGLRALMANGRQGVMATIVHSGIIQIGDSIRSLAPVKPTSLNHSDEGN
jgi:MOSC domain-containing protein YiiM